MTKKNKAKRTPTAAPAKEQSPWALPVVGVIILAVIALIFFMIRNSGPTDSHNQVQNNLNTYVPQQTASPQIQVIQSQPAATTSPEMLSMEVAKAVMVTVELDFPGALPSIADALTQIERRYQPADGQGRTFAILDAYGQPTAEGKLHLSMHVSSEKPGIGSLIFKPTGSVLWNSTITPISSPLPPKNLIIYIGDDAGNTWIIDGSGGVSFILDAKVRDKGIPVRDFWPDGKDREVTLVYSACGCPVKVMARRQGERLARTGDQPVIFPDDPAAVQTIARLMRW